MRPKKNGLLPSPDRRLFVLPALLARHQGDLREDPGRARPVALSPGRPESLLATILPFGVRTFLLSPLAGRRGDRLAHSGRYLYTVLLDLRKG